MYHNCLFQIHVRRSLNLNNRLQGHLSFCPTLRTSHLFLPPLNPFRTAKAASPPPPPPTARKRTKGKVICCPRKKQQFKGSYFKCPVQHRNNPFPSKRQKSRQKCFLLVNNNANLKIDGKILNNRYYSANNTAPPHIPARNTAIALRPIISKNCNAFPN